MAAGLLLGALGCQGQQQLAAGTPLFLLAPPFSSFWVWSNDKHWQLAPWANSFTGEASPDREGRASVREHGPDFPSSAGTVEEEGRSKREISWRLVLSFEASLKQTGELYTVYTIDLPKLRR